MAAYSVPSTLHLVVIAVKAKGHRGWKIYHAPTGEHLGSTDRGTLKDTLESVDRLGKVGDWGSLETIQETVPLELRRAAFKGDINSKATAKETATALVKQGIPPADKEPEDKPADAVGQAEEVSEKEAPKAKTGKDGYITLSGKLFGRAKKSNPKGDPTPWTVEVYRGTQREYVKGRTREEAVNEALKQWRDVPVLYQGHKGPGVGILKTDAPDRRDGDKDTVVAERRPRVSEKHPKSPIKLSDYGGLQDAIQDYKQTISVPKAKKLSAEKLMGYRSAKKKSHYTPRAGRGGSEMKAAKK